MTVTLQDVIADVTTPDSITHLHTFDDGDFTETSYIVQLPDDVVQRAYLAGLSEDKLPVLHGAQYAFVYVSYYKDNETGREFHILDADEDVDEYWNLVTGPSAIHA